MSIQKVQCRFNKRTENDVTEMTLYGVIGDYWDDLDAVSVVDAIREVATPTLTVRVHSDGGSVLEGIAIYNAFREYKGKLTFYVDSFAASMASYIIMAGSVEMYDNAYLLIHNPWAYVSGDKEEIRNAAMNLEKFTETMIDAYASKTKLSREKIAELMSAETLLTAKEAKTLGFCDTIISGGSASAVALMAKAMAKITTTPQPKPQEETMTITLEGLQKEHPDIVAKIQKDARDAETARVQDVLAQDTLGHDDVIKAMILDGKSTGADAAKAILAAEAAVRKSAASALQAASASIPTIPTIPTSPTTPTESEPTDEVGAKAQWEKDAKIRDEFGDFETYKAYVSNKQNAKVWKGGSK